MVVFNLQVIASLVLALFFSVVFYWQNSPAKKIISAFINA